MFAGNTDRGCVRWEHCRNIKWQPNEMEWDGLPLELFTMIVCDNLDQRDRELKLECCMFNKLAPNFSSLRNLESLTITDPIPDLRSMQDLDRLTQLTIRLQRCYCSPALVCPRNLLQLDISNHSYSVHKRVLSLAFDEMLLDAGSMSMSLEEIRLTNLDLTAIPAPIARLHGLKRVDLSCNKLAGELCKGPWLDSLEELCLMGNLFTQLPSALLQCKGRLRKLDISDCKLNKWLGEELSDQTKDLYQELVAARTEVLLGERAHSGLGTW